MIPVDANRAIAELLGLAISDPDAAEDWARGLLAGGAGSATQSAAHQALGIVWRDRGHLADAITAMRTAVRLGVLSQDPDREADARATLGATLAVAGRTTAGLAELGAAIDRALDAVVTAKALVRRGHVHFFLRSRPDDALADLTRALVCLRDGNEPVWLARTLNLLAMTHLALGRTAQATAAIEEAGAIFEREGQTVEYVVTVHNRGTIAQLGGDLPRAMQLYDAAADGYAAAGVDTASLVADQCELLLTAGLADEAVDLVSARLEAGRLAASQEAELVFRLATAQLAIADTDGARVSASRARAAFRRQGRLAWAAHAGLASVVARHQGGEGGRRLAADATAVARELESDGSEAPAVAWLVAGQLSADAKLPEARDRLGRAAAYRSHSSDLVRATGWQARAIERETTGDRRGTLAACARGLDALDAHRATLGSTELRALATRRGDDLAAMALRQAVHTGPRVLLEWSERWRAAALTQPPVHPPDDQALAQSLAALRDTRRRLAEARAEGSPTVARLDDERGRLERTIRRRTHHLAGTSAATTRFRAADLVEVLGDTTFVELVDIDGTLHAITARAGRVTHVVVGPTTEAEQAVAFARFALRQTARGRPSDLDDVGRRLEAALLGDAVRRLGDGPVVISPPGRLHATPWALVPALTEVPITVAPSAALWLRARASTAPSSARVLIAGPGLESGGAELDTLALRHPEATLLTGDDATVERSLEALDGAAVAHVAAHGRFREDSPLFSSLDLDDGPLTVHDFERLGRAPHRIVLSACESGVVAPIGAGEMLGLVAAMLAMGSAGIVSSVAKVNDQATAELMLDVHAAMDSGAGLGAVLLRARQSAQGDRVREATAAAFLAMGA